MLFAIQIFWYFNFSDIAVARFQLQINFKDIVTTIKHRPIAQQLISRGVLKAEEMEEIEKWVGSIRRNQKLLEILWNKGTGDLKEFLSVLESDSTYHHLVAQIKNTKGNCS